MAWEGSNRRAELPPNWQKIRKRVLRRDGYQCRYVSQTGARCRDLATDVDHVGHKMNHELENLQALCSFHHSKKTGAQGSAASTAARREIDARWRRAESHPGAL